MAKITFKSLSKREQKLVKAAKRARENAYAPYSRFKVGAAILTEDGKRIAGANYESAAYGDSICAERVALTRANSQGYGNKCIAIAVVVTGNKDSPNSRVSAPCGSCRQLILEAAQRSGIGKDFEIIMATIPLDGVEVSDIGRLLPHAFGPEDLKKAENPEEISG